MPNRLGHLWASVGPRPFSRLTSVCTISCFSSPISEAIVSMSYSKTKIVWRQEVEEACPELGSFSHFNRSTEMTAFLFFFLKNILAFWISFTQRRGEIGREQLLRKRKNLGFGITLKYDINKTKNMTPSLLSQHELQRGINKSWQKQASTFILSKWTVKMDALD